MFGEPLCASASKERIGDECALRKHMHRRSKVAVSEPGNLKSRTGCADQNETCATEGGMSFQSLPGANTPIRDMSKSKRKTKLIKPGLQLRLTMVFVGLVSLALLLQFLLFTQAIMAAADQLPHDGMVLMNITEGVLLRVLALSFLVFLPLTYAVGVLATFRFSGPIYRFESFFRQVVGGQKPASIRLRENDELQELARLINDATAYLNSRSGDAGVVSSEREDRPSLKVSA